MKNSCSNTSVSSLLKSTVMKWYIVYSLFKGLKNREMALTALKQYLFLRRVLVRFESLFNPMEVSHGT